MNIYTRIHMDIYRRICICIGLTRHIYVYVYIYTHIDLHLRDESLQVAFFFDKFRYLSISLYRCIYTYISRYIEVYVYILYT